MHHSTIVASEWNRSLIDGAANDIGDLIASRVDLHIQARIVNSPPIHMSPAMAADFHAGRNEIVHCRSIQISPLTDAPRTYEKNSPLAAMQQGWQGDEGVAYVPVVEGYFDRNHLRKGANCIENRGKS